MIRIFDWLDKFAKYIVVDLLNVDLDSKLGGSIHFFIYDSIKILILLGIMIFIISYIRSYFSPEKTKKILTKYDGISGNLMASFLGIVTPFCSCSSVPLFIGFVEAGIPLGVTFSFLITSPIVNEAAVTILVASFGWKIAVSYVVIGVIVGVTGGMIIGKLNMEKEIEDYVFKIRVGETQEAEKSNRERIEFAIQNVKDIVKRIWIYLFLGIGIGAAIHGWFPEDLLAKYAGKDNLFGLVVAVIMAVPLYSNALGTIPIAKALILKGAGLGTALSFMMATTALSFPEMVLLRKVIRPKLIGVFVLITTIAILLVGVVYNLFSEYLL